LFSGLPTSHADLDPSFYVGQFASEVNEYQANLNAYGNPRVVDLVIGDARETMLPAIGREGFSLAFLDVDVWEVMRDLLIQLLSISRGGELIIVHDLGSPGVRQALKEFHDRSDHKVSESILHRNTIAKLEFPKGL
jgi:predicted O-methyltransferase YrrM